MHPFKEHEHVVLTAAVSGDHKDNLLPGDVGTVVHVHPNGEAFVVEFTASDGETITIATVLPLQARPVTKADLRRGRTVETAD